MQDKNSWDWCYTEKSLAQDKYSWNWGYSEKSLTCDQNIKDYERGWRYQDNWSQLNNEVKEKVNQKNMSYEKTWSKDTSQRSSIKEVGKLEMQQPGKEWLWKSVEKSEDNAQNNWMEEQNWACKKRRSEVEGGPQDEVRHGAARWKEVQNVNYDLIDDRDEKAAAGVYLRDSKDRGALCAYGVPHDFAGSGGGLQLRASSAGISRTATRWCTIQKNLKSNLV